MTQSQLQLRPQIVPLNGLSGLANLQTVWNASTTWEKFDGLHYYQNLHNRLRYIAILHNVLSKSVFAAFAALSPNNDERGNFKDLESCLSGRRNDWSTIKVHTYGPNRTKAMLVLNGEEPLDVLGGNKVRSFYLNILDPADRSPVTVDGHMVSVWNGKRLRLVRKGSDGAVIRDLDHYNTIANDIRILADAYRIVPCALQSTLWLTWKRMHKIVYNPQLQLEYGED